MSDVCTGVFAKRGVVPEDVDSLLIELFLFYLILEPTTPTVDIHRSLFEAHRENSTKQRAKM